MASESLDELPTEKERPPPATVPVGPYPSVGQTLGDYRIDGAVAEGPIGLVLTAVAEPLEGRVALKVLLRRWALDEAAARRFLGAAERAKALDHPRIVKTFGAREDQGRFFVATELVLGEDLGAYVERRGPLPPLEALDLARQIAGALEHAEGRGVHHGGLRPSNVFIVREPPTWEREVVRITDFGMSEVAPDARELDASTPPERIRGERGPAGDVFSLGALLYQLIVGQPLSSPWVGDPIELSRLVPDHAADVVPLLERLLRADPGQRVRSARDASLLIEALVERLGPESSTVSSGAAPSAPRDDLVGARLEDRFRIVCALRAGGMGQLYYATQDAEPKNVAIKVLHKAIASLPEAAERFLREAKLAAKLDHPHIVKLVHVGEDRRRLYIAMELLTGEDLSVRIKKRRRLPEAQAAAICVDVTSALAYAHELGVVHRDIKPSNVMMCAGSMAESAKILDFGIAKILERSSTDGGAQELTSFDSGLTVAGMLMGTPRYIAPEQALGGDIDARADLYSLGVVLYQLVTGVVPFDGDLLEIVERQVRQPPRPPSQIVPELNREMERLILDLLEKSPARRPSSAREVRDRLLGMRTELATASVASARRWSSVPDGAPIVMAPPEPSTLAGRAAEVTRTSAMGGGDRAPAGDSETTRREAAGGEAPPPRSAEATFLRVHEAIGRGGMGTVYRAEQIELERPVAFKRLIEAGSADMRERFVREAQITARLDHPNIVPVYVLDMGQRNRSVGYAMKLVEGKTLRALLTETRDLLVAGGAVDAEHSLPSLLEHFLKVCDAIAFAHDRGILHRDLKPANIMIGRFHEVYVMDWGIARPIGVEDRAVRPGTAAPAQEGAQLTRVGELVGSPRYAAPEQTAGRSDQLDARADQYALGLVLFEILALKPAVAAEQAQAAWEAASRGEKAPLEHVVPGRRIPPELAAIVAKATALDREDRYRSVPEMAEDVRRYLRGEAVAARPDTPIQKIVRWVARHGRTTLVSFVVLVALSAAAVTTSLYVSAERRNEARARGARKTKVYVDVAAQAHKIDANFQQMEEALEGLRVAAELSLAGAEPPASAAPVYFDVDFRNPRGRPPDFSDATTYRWPVSLEHPVAGVAPGVSADAVLPKLRRLSPLRHHMRSMFLVAAGADPSAVSEAEARAILAERRGPIDYAYVSLAEGVQYMLPGMAALPPGYDVRTAGFFTTTKGTHGRRWGSPYIDATTDVKGDDIVLPCTQGLWSRSGEFLGIAGVEITVSKLVKTSLSLPGYKTIRTSLVNGDGQKVVDSTDAGVRVQSNGKDDALPMIDFDIREVVTAIKAKGEGLIELEARHQIVVYARLDALGWYYVVELDASVLDKR